MVPFDGEGGAAERRGQCQRRPEQAQAQTGGAGGRAQKGRYLRLVLAGCILPADLVTAIGPLITEMCCMECLGWKIHKQAFMAYVICIRWLLLMHVLVVIYV